MPTASTTLLVAPCDPIRYREFSEPDHRSCIGNMTGALDAPGHTLAINFFTATTVEDGYMFNTPTALVAKPGTYVVLEALTDVICTISSCPYDLTGPGWAIQCARRADRDRRRDNVRPAPWHPTAPTSC